MLLITALELLHASYVNTAIMLLVLATLVARHVLHSLRLAVATARNAVGSVGPELVDLVDDLRKLRGDLRAFWER
jgi:hypothetical protein